MHTKLYGETTEEQLFKEKQQSRAIVQEVLDFPVNERQKYQVIKMLAENLEDYRHMQLLTWLIDELQQADLGDLTGLKAQALERIAQVQDGNSR